MNCSGTSIAIVVGVSVLSTILILAFIVWFFVLRSGGGDSGGDIPVGTCPTFSGVWYKETEKGKEDEGYAILSIGVCTDDATGKPSPFVDSGGVEWPMCGTLFVNGLNNRITGQEVYCSDCKFRFNSNCRIEMISPCLGEFSSQGVDRVFNSDGPGWILSPDGSEITTAHGSYKSIDPSMFPNKFIAGGDTPVVENTCDPTTKVISSECKNPGKWSQCGKTLKGCCCTDENNASCCSASIQKLSSINSILDFLGLEPKFP
jgi:hypothetical protein